MKVKCPHCGKDFELKLKCNRCNHEWIPRSERRPDVCPKCKSPYWDKPRIRNLRKESKS